MSPATQGLLIAFGCLLTALFTILIAQVMGMRDDLRTYITKQIEMDKTLALLKADHESLKRQVGETA